MEAYFDSINEFATNHIFLAIAAAAAGVTAIRLLLTNLVFLVRSRRRIKFHHLYKHEHKGFPFSMNCY